MVGLRIIAMAPHARRSHPTRFALAHSTTHGASLRGTRASPRTGLTPAGRSDLAARLSHVVDLRLFMAPEQSGRTRPEWKWSFICAVSKTGAGLRSAERGRRDDPRRRGLGGRHPRAVLAAREGGVSGLGVPAGGRCRSSTTPRAPVWGGVSWVLELALRAGRQPEARGSPKRTRAEAWSSRPTIETRGASYSRVGSVSLCPSRDTPQRARTP